MSTVEELQSDIDKAENLLAGFDPTQALDHGMAWKAWHAINDWRSMSQWFLDRKLDPNFQGTKDSKWRAPGVDISQTGQ